MLYTTQQCYRCIVFIYTVTNTARLRHHWMAVLSCTGLWDLVMQVNETETQIYGHMLEQL